VKCKLFK